MSNGKKAIVMLLISAFLFAVTSVSTSATAAAKTLVVRKIVENGDDIKVGDDVIIGLQFKNPFKQAIPLQIVDRNVFGNNGLDIKCLEYTLPAKEESVFAYSDLIVPFKPGKYTLDAAKVTYTNPETGKREMVESNTLDIQVNANNSQPLGQQAQGITTIYQCNGTNIRSTSYSSSGSSFNIQIGSSTHSYGYSYGNEQQQSGGQQQESVEKRVTNNQISQNTGQLKRELEKEMQQQKEQEERIREELAKNSEFLKYDKQLRNAGFNQTPASFNMISQNYTQVTIPYRNESTGAERRIKVDYINGTIQNVTLESIPEQKEERGSLWWLLLLIPLVGAIATGWFILDKYLKKAGREEIQPQSIAVESAQSVDYVSEARRIIEEAEGLFMDGREKDAYEKISKAIRFYFSYKLGIERELLNSELMNALKGKADADTYSKVNECLDLCGMVEFAKYRANREDFNKIAEMAKWLIV
ncbi:hypothetical protein DRN97_11530 [Methanosarcinales archaeon]|nr:MAG: hypothetical protein DRN97_11530 [Methanosarcinales archaeon]